MSGEVAKDDWKRNLPQWACFGFGGLLCLMALILLPLSYFAHQRALQSPSWPRAPGKILESELSSGSIKTRAGFQTEYRARVRYEFVLNGKKYSSENVSLGSTGSSTIEADIRAIVNRYPVGREVRVYYEPNNPQMSVLEPGTGSSTSLGYLIAGACLLIGVVLIVLGRTLTPTTPAPLPVAPSTPAAK